MIGDYTLSRTGSDMLTQDVSQDTNVRWRGFPRTGRKGCGQLILVHGILFILTAAMTLFILLEMQFTKEQIFRLLQKALMKFGLLYEMVKSIVGEWFRQPFASFMKWSLLNLENPRKVRGLLYPTLRTIN